MNKLLRGGTAIASRAASHAALALIGAYRLVLSPLLPRACRFHPSCSSYARDAVLEHGPWRGVFLSIRRVLRCHPFHPGGYDPVPASKASPQGYQSNFSGRI